MAKANTAAEYIPVGASIGALPGGTRFDAQTFTVAQAGTLTSMDIFAQAFGPPPGTLTVELLNTSGGIPVGGPSGILASVTVSGSVLPGFGSSVYTSVDFSSFMLNLLGGGQYAIAVTGSSTFGWLGTNGGYAGGSMYTSSNGGLSYAFFPTAVGDRDLGFRVNVTPASVPDVGQAPYVMGLAIMLSFASIRRAQRRNT